MPFVSYIEIKVVKFRPIGSVTTATVEMNLINGKPVNIDEPGVVTDGVVTLVGSYFVKVKKREHSSPLGTTPDDSQEMKIKFWVAPESSGKFQYMLQGVAFSNRDQKATAPENRLGQVDFPSIEIVEENLPSIGMRRVFTITNSRLAGKDLGNGKKEKVSYDYLFLIQEIEHGAIGIIDPEWENEPI